MRHTLAVAVVLVAAIPSLLPAQVVRGGDLVTTNYSSPSAVFRVDHLGNVTTLHAGAPLSGPAGITVAQNRDVIVADFGSSSLVRIDATTGAASVIAGGLGGPLRVAELRDGDFVVTSNSGRSLLRVTPAGAVTTLASGAPFNRPFGVMTEPDGNLLVADDLGRRLHRVDPITGAITTLVNGGLLRLPQGIALFPNGDLAVIDGVVDCVFRVDRSTNAVTTWVPTAALGVNPEGIVDDGAGGFFVCHSGSPGGNGIRVIDATGNASAATGAAAWTNPEDTARVPLLSGPRTLLSGPGGLGTFSVDAPGSANEFYTLILSGSVHPGWNLPAPDPRALFLNVDPFFLATVGQNSPPFTVGWTGFLDAGGRATATVDLRVFGPGFLSGLRVYQQGLTMTPQLQMRSATNVLRLDFP